MAQKDEILKMVVALKAQKIPVSKIEADLLFSNGLIGKAAKGETELSNEKFMKLENYFKEKLGVQEPITKTKMTIKSNGTLSLKPSDEALKRAKEAMDKINKDFGAGSIMCLGDKPLAGIEIIPTGSLSLNVALGVGGLPKGRMVEIYGPESCLDSETFIQYEIRTKNGKRQNHKGGSIKRLYERFNNFSRPGQGYYKRPQTINSEYFASCMNEEGKIFQNKIEQVVYTGSKECFEITTIKGHCITATEEHKFFNGEKYVPVSKLKSGDILMIHNNTPFKKEKKQTKNRKYVFTKNHPIAGIKVIDEKYIYSRVANSRLVFEAHMNGLTKEEFTNRLESENLLGLKFLNREDHVHHLDEDIANDSPSNLVLLSASKHGKLHAMQRHNNLRYAAVPDEIITITHVGIKETYDIRMQSPFNNYIANNFVVHNSGKTTVALHIIAEAQKLGGMCAFIDAEHAFDETYAKAIGVQIEKLHLSQPDYGEQALEEANRLIDSGGFAIVVIDSVAALVPKGELEGKMGDSKMGSQARLMSQACRKLAGTVSKTNTILIFINQLRSTIGNMYVFEVTSGGNALKYYASVRLEVRKSGKIVDGEEQLGCKTKVKVVKNKVAPPFKIAEFDIIFGEGIDYIGEIIDVAVDKNVIQKSGSWYSYKDNKLGQGREGVKQILKDNPEILQEIELKIKP